MSTPPAAGRHAVVIGGGLAGLLAARVLTEHFERVTLLDRDQLRPEVGYRAGVPQSRHGHVLLIRGQQIFDELFPGFTQQLVSAGALVINATKDFVWMSPAGFAPRFDGQAVLCASRELIESTMRERLRALPAVSMVGDAEVVGLSVAEGACAGVKLGGRSARSLDPVLAADLTVDASGRASALPEWLSSLGYPAPKETLIDSSLGYASRYYEVPPTAPDWKLLYVQAKPPESLRAAVLLPIEGNRWHVTLGGTNGDHPSTDEVEFLEFAKSLRSSVIYAAISSAKPLTKVFGFRGGANRRRHYEAMPRWPRGLIALGDSFCCVNPIYGQGMTMAGLSAMVLRAALTSARPGHFERTFHKRQGAATQSCWMLATGEDFRFPKTTGTRPPALRLVHAYLDRVITAATRDPHACLALLKVLHLVAPMTALFTPRVLWSALFAPPAAAPLLPPGRPA